MRQICGTVIPKMYQFHHPFRMIISGSSGTGKTTFCEKMIESDIIDYDFTNIFYIYPEELDSPPVDWDERFPEKNIEYMNAIPDLMFFNSVPRNSLIIVDDLWTEACNSPEMIKAYKVFSRKMQLSLVLVSQSYFSGGQVIHFS